MEITDRREVMLDLETWGTRPGCAIRSIGAVIFNPYMYGVECKFYCNVRRDSCESWGLTIDPKTEAWWAEQSEEAKAALLEKPLVLADALNRFRNWYNEYEGSCVWAHGATFDVPILEAAFEAVGGAKAPWGFREIRDTRTVFAIADYEYRGTAHHALQDAIDQAIAVQKAIRRIDDNASGLFAESF